MCVTAYFRDHPGGCHEAKKQSLFIAYSNDLGVTLGVTNQEGLVLHVTHRCVKLLHTRISWCHIWPFPLCNLWHQCDTRCDTKWIRVCNKKRLPFGLMALPILSLSTWHTTNSIVWIDSLTSEIKQWLGRRSSSETLSLSISSDDHGEIDRSVAGLSSESGSPSHLANTGEQEGTRKMMYYL